MTPAVALILALASPPGRAAPPALTPPAPEVVSEAAAIVGAMKSSPRGPYSRIAWFCNDGTTWPPVPYACGEHGGGKQHAEYSPDRQRLAELGWPAGTITAALTWEELWDEGRRHLRLRQLPLERYLEAVDDGWVLRRARSYRGRVQIEDEEAAGRDLLVQLLGRREWVSEEFLLARESVRALPHHGGADRTRRIRRLAEEIARADESFQPLRIRIHTSPDSADGRAVRAWSRSNRETARAQADSLAAELDELFSASGRMLRLTRARKQLDAAPPHRDLAALLAGVETASPPDRVRSLSDLLRALRERIESRDDGAGNLALMDLSREAESELIASAFTVLDQGTLERRALAALATHLLDATYGVGLLSASERDAAADPLRAMAAGSGDEVDADAWLGAARALRRTGTWTLGAVRWTFAEPLVRWSALEPVAVRFPDELLRGSPALPLAEVVRAIVTDAEAIAATPHRSFGQTASGFLGLNPGVAVGVLRFVEGPEMPSLAREEIVALPRTVSELPPVAGILTLSEGNLLSHVQILARNLGIPNAVVSPTQRDLLQAADGDSVLLAVSTTGSVVIERWDALPDSLRRALAAKPDKPAAKVVAPRPDLKRRDPIPLSELHGGLSGRVVGPKAANLGDLARAFPGRVAPAVAVPFGVFAEHVSAGENSPKERLDRAFREHRAGDLDDAGLAARVEEVRAAIAALSLEPRARERLVNAMRRELGESDTLGIFVRSDTNVEDLPGFTGAGLNETVPNVVGLEAQLAAIPRVWASPFRERAMAWRASLLESPEEVYTSVLLMRSVPSEKSGVLVTSDLVERGTGLTVATAWGVGGAVDNETAETLVLRPDGGTTLVSEAKAPYRRKLLAEGGVGWVPARSGPVLTASERDALRNLAAEIGEKFRAVEGPLGPRPWDVEFGFVAGELQLFQIRPLVERGQQRADAVVASLAGDAAPERGAVSLREAARILPARPATEGESP